MYQISNAALFNLLIIEEFWKCITLST